MSKETAVAERPNRDALVATMRRIEEIRTNHERSFAVAANDIEKSFILSCSLIDLRQAIKPFAVVLKQLQGSKLGFRTDKDRDGGYPEPVLIDCAIEASIRGARWTGNEFNIIAGGCYLTKEYWWRMVREIPGISDLDLSPGVPGFENQKCVVDFEASWKLDGKPAHMVRRFSILVRSGQSDDATLGKAEARMLKAIHKRITGTTTTDADDDEPRVQVRQARQPQPLADGEIPADDHPGRLFAPPEGVGAIK